MQVLNYRVQQRTACLAAAVMTTAKALKGFTQRCMATEPHSNPTTEGQWRLPHFTSCFFFSGLLEGTDGVHRPVPLGTGGAVHPILVLSDVVSKLPLPLYADVRTFPMTCDNDAGQTPALCVATPSGATTMLWSTLRLRLR